MPIYEYNCTNCNHHFDLIQKINDEPVKQCPHCHANTAIRLISAAGFQLKGSGWYATDFKNKERPAEKKEAASTDKKPEDKKTEDKKTAESTTSTRTKGESE